MKSWLRILSFTVALLCGLVAFQCYQNWRHRQEVGELEQHVRVLMEATETLQKIEMLRGPCQQEPEEARPEGQGHEEVY